MQTPWQGALAQYDQFTFDKAVEAAAGDSAVRLLGPFILVDNLDLQVPRPQVNIWFPKLAGFNACAHSLPGQDVAPHLSKQDKSMTAVTGVTTAVEGVTQPVTKSHTLTLLEQRKSNVEINHIQSVGS
jgi:hypothetical protein